MAIYLLRRLVLTIPVVLGIVIATFFLVQLIPGDAVSAMQGQLKMSAQQMVRMREALGLNDPMHIQLGSYLARLARGDLGRSLFGAQPVALLIRANIGATFRLTIAGMLVAMLIGIPLGVFAAVRRGTFWDVAATVIAMLGVSVPGFWLGLMMIQLFAVTLGWLPITGDYGLRGLIMPAAALGLAEAAIITRLTRSTLLDVLDMDYVRTARAKGSFERAVVWKHALRNALLPLLAVIGMQFGTLFGGAVIIENVFSRQGLGALATQAVINRDFPVVQGCVMVAAVLYVLVNLLIDVLFGVVDPRIRYD